MAQEEPDNDIFDRAKLGDLESIRRLADAGADFCVRDAEGNTALHCAVYHGHKEMAKFLAEMFPDLGSVQNGTGDTAINLAAWHGRVDIVKFLAEMFPATAATVDRWGYNALHSAASCGRERIIEILATRFPELVEEKTAKGETPLHLAASFLRMDSVEALLKNGADPTAVNESGETSDDIAKNYSGTPSAIQMLLRAAAKEWVKPENVEKRRAAAFARMRDQQRKLGALRPKVPGL